MTSFTVFSQIVFAHDIMFYFGWQMGGVSPAGLCKAPESSDKHRKPLENVFSAFSVIGGHLDSI